MKWFSIIFVGYVTFYLQVATCSSIENKSKNASKENNEKLRNYGDEIINTSNSKLDSETSTSEETETEYTVLQNREDREDNDPYKAEKMAGDMADLFGINVHYRQPENYNDLGRRFMEFKSDVNKNNLNRNNLTPMKAPPELVMAVAKESALLEAAKPINPTDEVIRNNVLRTGDYWDSVWKEDVDYPTKVLRSKKDKNEPEIRMVQMKIKPGSKMYQLISVLKQISPRLLYVINKKE